MPNLPRVPSSDRQLGRLLNLLATGTPNTCKVADLPARGLSNGAGWFATDGLKVGETTGGGTGCPVYFDEASVTWLRTSDDTVVSS